MTAEFWDWLLLLCGFALIALILWAVGNWSSEGK